MCSVQPQIVLERLLHAFLMIIVLYGVTIDIRTDDGGGGVVAAMNGS